MQLTPLAFAVAAAGFVIIPELSEADENIFKALPFQDGPLPLPVPADENIFKALPFQDGPLSLPVPAESHKISVPCKQCEGQNSHLQLNLDVVDHTRLLLNGFEVYPNADPWHGDLAAAVESTDREATKQKLGYSLAVAPEFMDLDSHIQALDVELRIIEVGNRFVDNVPVVNVKLVKTPSGEIAIAEVDTTSAKSSGCHSMACTAKEVMAEAFKALKNFKPFKDCHRRPHQDKNKKPHQGNTARPQSDDTPETHGDKHPHHRFGGENKHEWGRLMTNITAQVFLPVLMGITAGVGVALFTMAVRSLFFQITYSIRGKRDGRFGLCRFGRGRAIEKVSEESIGSEKVGLLVEECEAPPLYDDAKNEN